MKYNVSVFIGRFQPLTLGHEAVFREALAQSQKLLIIVGSATGPRSYRNPFTFGEREEMILNCLTEAEKHRVHVTFVEDITYNETAWAEAVQTRVTTFALANFSSKEKIALIGFSKDNTSYYLKMFPQWESVEVKNYLNISATPTREMFFSRLNPEMLLTLKLRETLSESTIGRLLSFKKRSAYKEVADEYDFISNYTKQWGAGPFLTVDACVIQSGNILMIKRGGRPGIGQVAMPGGFMDKGELLDDAVIRELKEETRIDVPPAVLRGSIVHKEIFDSPHRDPRARIITQCYLFQLPKKTYLPDVKGGDDAASASWIPLADLHENVCFGDHYHIIRRMVGMLK